MNNKSNIKVSMQYYKTRLFCCEFRLELRISLLFAEVLQLRKKFEEDKQQIATMKAARKFRPY